MHAAEKRRQSGPGVLLLALLPGLAGLLPLPAAAQLRPVEPLRWEIYQPGAVGLAELGLGVLGGQRAALAGTEGRLLELGNFTLLARTGRVALELSGTARRRFQEHARWADTAFGAHPTSGHGSVRADAGDLRVSTTLRLTPERWPLLGVLRFGARLPTTAAGRGLDRGQTDFLGGAGLAWRGGSRGQVLAGVESGIGILGTRIPEFEQQDDWIYTAHLSWQAGLLQPRAAFTGQSSPLRYRRIRGNEDLRELRLGLRAGRRRWLQAEWVHGLVEASPRSGLLLSAGALFR